MRRVRAGRLAPRQQDRELLGGVSGQPAAQGRDHGAGLGDRHAGARTGVVTDVLAGDPDREVTLRIGLEDNADGAQAAFEHVGYDQVEYWFSPTRGLR